MKNVNEPFKEYITSYGRQIKAELEVKRITDNVEEQKSFGTEYIYSITPVVNGQLLKSIMKELVLEVSGDVLKKKDIVSVIFSVKKDSQYESINFSDYEIYNIKKEENSNTYKAVCYDNMLKSMVEYKTLKNGSFPMTLGEYLGNLCLDIGLKNTSLEFTNSDKILQIDPYENLGYTYRDIFDEISACAGGSVAITEGINIEVRYIKETAETIDEKYLKDDNVNIYDLYGPINSLVLSRNNEDNIFRDDKESISENGLCEVKIVDNQIMNNNDRDSYIDALFEKVKGISYYLNDYESTGIFFLEFLDKYTLKCKENEYNCVLFNSEIKITQGIEEIIYTDKPEVTQTDYTKADKTDRKLNQTISIVNKQAQDIKTLISKTDENSEKITNTSQTVDEISTEVSNAAVYKRIVKGLNDLVTEEAANTNVLNCTLYCTQSITSEITLSIICRDKPRGEAANIRNLIAFKIPSLRYKDDTIRDFISIKENSFFITRKIDENDNVLDEPVIEELVLESSSNVDNMVLVEGINYIMYSISPNTGGTSNQFEMEVEYLLKNDFTDRFASKVEVDSKISQTSTEIMTEVNKKVDEEKFGTKITQNAESVKIAWNQIGQNVKLETGEDGKAKFNIYDDNDNLLMSLDVSGMNFYSSELLGKMGIVTQGDNKYIAFNVPIDYDSSIGNGFAWGVTNNTTGTFYPILYLKDFYMGPEQSDVAGGELILANCGLTIEGQNRLSLGNIMIMAQDPISGDMTFIDKVTGKTLFSIVPGNDGLLTYDTIKILSNISMYVNQEYADVFKIGTDETNSVWATSNGYLYALQLRVGENGISTPGGISAGGDINTTGYVTGHIQDLSNAKFKTDIQKFEERAIDKIKNTEIYSFLYKDKKSAKKTIGAVIGENYKCDKSIISEDEKHINLYSMISLAYKAIQEQQTEIEELKEKILKLEGIINENNSK